MHPRSFSTRARGAVAALALLSGLRIVWAICLATALAACARTPPEQALRQTIAQLQSAVEQRDAAALKDALAEDFIGPDGMDRQQAVRMAQGLFFRQQDVDARLGPLDMELRKDQARVSFTAVLTGGRGLFPDTGEVYQVDTDWRLEGGQWQLVRASWKR